MLLCGLPDIRNPSGGEFTCFCALPIATRQLEDLRRPACRFRPREYLGATHAPLPEQVPEFRIIYETRESGCNVFDIEWIHQDRGISYYLRERAHIRCQEGHSTR